MVVDSVDDPTCDDHPDREPVVLGWPPDGPKLRLDHHQFSYAGKFVMTNTGKAVIPSTEAPTDIVDAADVLAAASFNADRTDEQMLWIRYVTVCEDRRGAGLGPRLCAFVAERAADRGYDRVRIAVNNPFAFDALYRAGFAYTGEETGVAELVLERPTDRPAERSVGDYQHGIDAFRERDLSGAEAAFLERKQDTHPPETVCVE